MSDLLVCGEVTRSHKWLQDWARMLIGDGIINGDH